MQCEEWADANSELFKEAHDETVHKNSYKSRLYELISASLVLYANYSDLSSALSGSSFLWKEPALRDYLYAA